MCARARGAATLRTDGVADARRALGKKYESGLHREGQTWLYVTRGIGMEGGPAPRVRFFARPEVTVIELVPEGERVN